MPETTTVTTPESDRPQGETYETRERVHTEGEAGVLVVLATLDTRSDRYELTDGITLHSLYPGTDPSDPVVLCMYDRVLDRQRPDWRSEPVSTLRNWTCIENGDTPPKVHAYPSGVLDRYTAGNYTKVDGRVCCENCTTWLDSVVGWVEHLARECDGHE